MLARALALGLPQQTPFAIEGAEPSGGAIDLGDIDFEQGRANVVEIVQVVADGVRIWRPERHESRAQAGAVLDRPLR